MYVISFFSRIADCMRKNENIVGKWMQVPELKQGFVLEADGKHHRSIWLRCLIKPGNRKEPFLILFSGKSVWATTRCYPFSDTLHIEKLTQDSLILKKGRAFSDMQKEDTISQKKLNENIPASLIAPAKNIECKGKTDNRGRSPVIHS